MAALGATGVALASVSIAQLLVGDTLLPRSVVLGSAAILVPWYVLCWALAGDAHARAEDRDRVVLVCSGDEVATLEAELQRAPERPAVLVASVSAAEARPVDPPVRPLVELVERHDANVLVLCRDAQSDEEIVAQAADLHSHGVRVRTLSLFYEQWLGKLPVSELERVSLLFDIGEVHAPRYARVKRMLDLVLASCGAVVLVVLIPFVVVGNVLGNRGPLLYRQPRVGRSGAAFQIFKLRTMRSVDGVDRADPTVEGDPRVTPFGRLLRRTHLDELPQVLNMLRGELSVVGPRPEQPHLVERLGGQDPVLRDAPSRSARAHGLGAGEVPLRRRRERRAREAAVRRLLPPAPGDRPRPADRGADAALRPRSGGPMSTPLVTVLVPARDEASHLPECLAAIAAQDHPLARLEVIVVVDGATRDDSRARCGRAARARGLRTHARHGQRRRRDAREPEPRAEQGARGRSCAASTREV